MTTTRRNDYLPLSPLQEGLVFEHAVRGTTEDRYVMQVDALLSTGESTHGLGAPAGAGSALDPQRLRAALDRILVRYPNLRACFRTRSTGETLQVVVAAVAVPWREVDLTGLTPAEADESVEEVAADDRSRPFDLREPPLLRATLVALPGGRHRLLLAMHHVVVDGWSVPLLLHALAAEYEADEAAAPVPDETFRAYLRWLHEQDTAAAEAAWRSALGDLDGPTLLAGEDPAPGHEPDPAGAPHPVSHAVGGLDAAGTARLGIWAREHGLTTSTVVQGCWALLLARLTGRPAVSFGLVDSGRACPVDGMAAGVGLFASTVPVHVRLDPRESVHGLLERMQGEQAELLDVRHVGLGRIQRAVGTGPMFDTLLTVQNYRRPADETAPAAGSLRLVQSRVHAVTDYPVTVTVVPGEQLALEVAVLPGTVLPGAGSPSTAADLVTRLEGLLESLVPAGSLRVGLELLPTATVAELLAPGRGPAPHPGADRTYDLVADAAERFADRVAFCTATGTLTYGELLDRANRLARVLVRRGIGPGDLVGVCCHRTPELLVALLATAATGAAYLPMDPGAPLLRTADVLADSGARLVLAVPATLGAVPHGDAYQVLCLGDADLAARTGAESGSRVTAGELSSTPLPEHCAYVMFTSGSTGRPKGVAVSQRALANLVVESADAVGMTGASVVLAVAHATFDISAMDFYSPLLVGARVVLADEESIRDVPWLTRTLRSAGVTHMLATPAHWAAIIDEEPSALGRVRVSTGGEALSPALARRLVDAALSVANLYGPTEATVWSSGAVLDPDAVPHIGVPLAGYGAYVLDPFLRPVAPGVTGELYVRGTGVADGYVGRAALTAARFVADPFGPEGTRMYRTGDLARWDERGRIHCLGRVDHQVKIRGHRIELGEIESLLLEHPDVSNAVVVPAEAVSGASVLVAYVTPAADAADAPDPDRLMRDLAERLPVYMVPATVVVLPELPVTTSGKVDRRALPAAVARPAAGRSARTPQEQILCELVGEVLGTDEVSIDDDFFALGGHSLLAARLTARVRGVMGVELPVRTVFDHPTVATLAAVLDERLATEDGGPGSRSTRPPLVPLAGPQDRPTSGPLSSAQAGLWFLSTLDPGAPTYNMPLAVRFGGEFRPRAFAAAVGALVARHEVLRTVYVQRDGQLLQQVLPAAGVTVDVPLVDVRSGTELAEHLRTELLRGFDLAHEVPVRCRVYREAPDQHVVLLVIHHIAGDGASMRVVVDDLTTAYTAALAGRPVALPAPAVQYLDYVGWADRVLGDPLDPASAHSTQLGYWTAQLAGAPTVLSLPVDRPRPERPTGTGASVPLSVDAGRHRRLVALARELDATPAIVLKALFAATLTRLGAGTDLPVGSPSAGRTDMALEDCVGLFVNSLVLRFDTSGNPSFTELVARARSTVIAALDHQDVAFEKVVEAVNPPRSAAVHPLFQVAIAVQNYAAPALRLSGLSASSLPLGGGTAKFDLSLELTEVTSGAGIEGTLEYSTDLFDERTARRIAAAYSATVTAALADPGARMSDWDVLSEEDARSVLGPWRGEGVEPHAANYPQARTLDGIVAAWAGQRPDALAVEHYPDGPDGRAQTLSFAELDAAMNRTARELVAAGCGAGDIVALMLPRGAEMVTTLLGVLASGAAYLPVDPSYPAERVRVILEDAAPTLVVSTRESSATLGALDETPPVLLLDDALVASRLAGRGAAPLSDVERRRPQSPDDLAYVIYTSGSTGRPKGVLITHRTVAETSLTQCLTHGITAQDRVTQFASFSFDATVWEMSISILGGCALVVVPDEARTGAPLAEFLVATRPTVTCLPPVVVGSLPAGTVLPTETTIVCGGEALPTATVTRFAGTNRFVNVYGPTEATVIATATSALAPGEAPPIGRVVGPRELYVLDEYLRPVPPGVTGELYISGRGLAVGYLRRPARTAASFVADPFATDGRRIYRTGDLVRWREDGQLDFVGRIDHQVKVNGFRIELDEIRHALATRPGVSQAVVVVREDRPGVRRIVAYVVPGAAGVDPHQLRESLADALPHYMVPAAVVPVDSVPLTVNGKIDAARLPRPGAAPDGPVGTVPMVAGPSGPAEDGGGGATATTLEERVLAAFARVLEVPGVTLSSDFFDLGGNSIRVVELVAELARTGLVVGIGDVMRHRTPAGLLAGRASPPPARGHAQRLVAASGAADPYAPVLGIRGEGALDPVFCVHGGVGLALPYLGLTESVDRDRPIVGLQAPAADPDVPLPGSVPEVAADYVRRVQEIQPSGPYHLFGWSYGGIVAQEMAVQLQAAGERVALLVSVDGYPYRAGSQDAPAEEDLVSSFTEYLDVDMSGQEAPPGNAAELLSLLESTASPLAAVGLRRVQRFVDLMRHHGELVAAHVPRVFDGDIHVVVSMSDGTPDPREQAARWRPGVTGTVVAVALDAEHNLMMHPRPGRTIGRVLDGWLADLPPRAAARIQGAGR